MLQSKLLRLSVVVCAVTLMGNQCGGTAQTGLPQTPGNYILLDQHHYPGFAGNYLGAPADCLKNPDGPLLQSKANAAGWHNTEALEDDPSCNQWSPAIYASMFSDSTAQNADFIWFTGHGDEGRNVLYNYSPSSPDCTSNANTQCFWGNSAGLPTGGKLKWIFAVASHNTDELSWTSAFNQNGPGLEGYYGVSGEPDGNRGDALVNEFFKEAVATPTRAAIRDAWMNSVNYAFSGRASYGMWELSDAKSDPLSASGGQSARKFSSSVPLHYTNSSDTYEFRPNYQSLSDTSPGSYQPIVLSTESYSDSSLASQSANYGGQPVAPYYYDSNTYHITGDDYTADHYEGSQGLVVAGHHSLTAYNYNQADSQTFAESFMSQQGNALPSDAVLQNVKVVNTTPQNGAPVLMGYTFTYAHADGTIGGDAITVSVDNLKQRVCQVVNENDPPRNKPPCLQWGYDYNQHVNYFYRLWRQRSGSGGAGGGGLRYPLGQRGAGATALSPNQAFSLASAAAPQLKGTAGTLLGYTYAYWTPGIESLDNTAYPAYHFYFSNHIILSADAYSGAVLGSSG